MKILLNFIGVILAFLAGVSCRQLLKRQRNKVHFYVVRDKIGDLWLYLGKPVRGNTEFYCGYNKKCFCLTYNIELFGLNNGDYNFLKWEDEPVEVFLNLED